MLIKRNHSKVNAKISNKHIVFMSLTTRNNLKREPFQIGVEKAAPPWPTLVSGLVGHFVQTWPDSECSHTVQCLDCRD